MSEETLEKYYQESLEERIISYLAKEENISLEQAMDIYYRSHMAEQIHKGKYGIQYLDYKVLVQMLIESEPELFEEKSEASVE